MWELGREARRAVSLGRPGRFFQELNVAPGSQGPLPSFLPISSSIAPSSEEASRERPCHSSDTP
jgi:hypothetical protein